MMKNEIMKNHFRFMRHMKMYFLLRYAIKNDDIDMFKQSLKNACVMFQTSKNNTFNYVVELIRLIHLYCFEIANVMLQKIMLINNLMNFQNRKNKCFEIDRFLKYLNEILKKNLNARRNFIKNFDDLIVELILIVFYILQFRIKIHEFVHRVYRNDHSKKNATKNIRIMIAKIFKRNMLKFDHRRFSIYMTTNLFKNNAQHIEVNVDKYNEKFQMNVE